MTAATASKGQELGLGCQTSPARAFQEGGRREVRPQRCLPPGHEGHSSGHPQWPRLPRTDRPWGRHRAETALPWHELLKGWSLPPPESRLPYASARARSAGLIRRKLTPSVYPGAASWGSVPPQEAGHSRPPPEIIVTTMTTFTCPPSVLGTTSRAGWGSQSSHTL